MTEYAEDRRGDDGLSGYRGLIMDILASARRNFERVPYYISGEDSWFAERLQDRAWIMSKSQEVGAFEWMCHCIGVNVDEARERYEKLPHWPKETG